MLVGGEAGIGKSRLVNEFTLRAKSEALVLSGACAPFGTSPPPFMPMIEAFRVYAHAAGEEERARLSVKVQASAWLLPELERAASHRQRVDDSEAGQSLVFGQLLEALEAVASRELLVIVLEEAPTECPINAPSPAPAAGIASAPNIRPCPGSFNA